MSPRIKRLRKVLNPPPVKGFKPYGREAGNQKSEPVVLLFEEYEALRLCDYDMCNHHRASVIMNVSRPTFTRIYASARQKIAKAFVEGKQIAIEGGKVYFDSDWYHCTKCRCYFNNPDREKEVENCPLCGSAEIVSFETNNAGYFFKTRQCDDFCVCPDCGFEQKHQYGKPCSKIVCPQCNTRMRRKGSPYCWDGKER